MSAILDFIKCGFQSLHHSYMFLRPVASLPLKVLTILNCLLWFNNVNQTIINHLSIQWLMFLLKDVIEQAQIQSSYEVIHAGWNLVIAVDSLPDMAIVLYSPLSACNGPSAYTSILLIIHVHVFHVLGYSPLKTGDLYHHIVMIIFCIPFAFAMEAGKLTQYCSFFICGLPGIFTYGAIAGYRNRVISKNKSRIINSVVNTYIRCPFAIIGAYIGFLNTHMLIELIPCLLVGLNGIYYNTLSIKESVKQSR